MGRRAGLFAAAAASLIVGPARGDAGLELALPFDGVWGVVQGFDSGETHQGYAAFALDFAPPQDVARFAQLAHPRLEDFACFGRPVLAPADGRVVRIATGFPDLAPYAKLANTGGKTGTKAERKTSTTTATKTAAQQNGGGNFVIIQHAPHVYTELVHLKAGSVGVQVGQAVRRGQPVGACGNSGNARTPHLHLGLLASISPITTARMRLAGYEVRGADGRWTPGDGEPKQGQWVRPAQSSGR